MLDQLALRQEDYRGILRSIRAEETDKTFANETIAKSVTELEEDVLIALATIKYEMSGWQQPDVEDLVWAGELLDHLDTLGWKLVRK